MKRLIRKLQKSARSYILLTTTGSVLLVAAPGVALYQLLKPAPDKKAIARRKKMYEQIVKQLSEWNDTFASGLFEISNELNENLGQALFPEQEEWLREHKKIFKKKDQN